MSPNEAHPLDPPAAASSRRAINVRSVLIGMATTAFIALMTPYNDYVLNNTAMIGNNLPLIVVMLALLFAVFINGPLNRWLPRHAFSSGEMTVMFSIALVGCALPSSGLMRYLPPSLVSPYSLAQGNTEYRKLLEALKLPEWMLPSFASDSVHQRMMDPVVTGYAGRWSGGERFPYMAWIKPMLAWGIFIFALFGALMCMVTIVRRQWNDNERLPFPLAQIQMALIEQPAPGRFFNSMLGQRSLWIVFSVVIVIRTLNGLGEYAPTAFPKISMGYDFSGLFTEPPFSEIAPHLKSASIYLIAVGVTFFLSSSVALSLWLFIILEQAFTLIKGGLTGDSVHYGARDEHIGAVLALVVAIAWVGRKHWAMVIAQSFRRRRPEEPQDEYLPYRIAFWGLVGCAAVMFTWLWLAGCTAIGAGVAVVLLLTLFLVTTRIIAETGLVYGQLMVPLYKPWQILASYGWTKAVPLQTFYVTGLLQTNFFDFREPMPVYASHSLKLADQTVFAGEKPQRGFGIKFIGLLMVSLLLSYGLSFSSVLWSEYSFVSTQDVSATTPISEWGAEKAPKLYLLTPSVAYQQERATSTYDQASHVVGGFAMTGLLSFLRLKYAWWPLHPIGFLMIQTTPARLLWFSIMIGWLAKVLIVRFGGASLYQKAKPIFLGLILGECAASGLWLIVSLVLYLLGHPYQSVNIMPI